MNATLVPPCASDTTVSGEMMSLLSIESRDAGTAHSPSRFYDIDRSKGAAILLVVVGHIWAPQSPSWAQVMHFDIYNFHMPFFMYLSGYVFFSSVNGPKHSNWLRYLCDRADRLLVPFIVFGIMVINVKFAAKALMGVRSFNDLRRSDFGYWEGYKHLVINTSNSPAFDLWYLFVLFVFSVMSYGVARGPRQKLWCPAALSLVLYSAFAFYEPRSGMTDNIYAAHICWFYVFFVTGMLMCACRKLLARTFQSAWPYAFCLFIVVQALINITTKQFVGDVLYNIISGWRFFVVGFLSIVFIHGFFIHYQTKIAPLLLILSQNTMIIYLLNSVVVAAAQALFNRSGYSQTVPYALQVTIITFFAVLIPILIHTVVKRYPLFAFMRRYIS